MVMVMVMMMMITDECSQTNFECIDKQRINERNL